MREEKSENIPDEKVDKPRMHRFFKDSCLNMRDQFNDVMLAYARKDPKVTSMMESLKDERGNIYSIGIGIMKNPESNSIAVSPQLMGYALLALAFYLDWKDMVHKMIIDSYDGKKGFPIGLTSAFLVAMEKGQYGKVKDSIAQLFKENRQAEACGLLGSIGDKKLSMDFKSELNSAANEGEGAAKMSALSALSAAVFDDSEIRTTFMNILDDWDDDARYFSAAVLSKVKDNSVAERALELLAEEHDAKMKFHLTAIVENNREHTIPLLVARLEKAKTKKEAEEIISLLVKLEKREKLKELATKFKDKLGEVAKAALDKFLK